MLQYPYVLYGRQNMKNTVNRQIEISILLGYVFGGVEKIFLNLAAELKKRSVNVNIILIRGTAEFLKQIPPDIEVIDLKSGRSVFAVPKLISYLRKSKPRFIIVGSPVLHGIIAAKLANSGTKIVIGLHGMLSKIGSTDKFIYKSAPLLARLLYPLADMFISGSKAAALDVSAETNIPFDRIIIINNPVITKEIFKDADKMMSHPWMQDRDIPVILAAGRLAKEKNYVFLIKAFAVLVKQADCRLVILGNGPQLGILKKLVHEQGVDKCVAFEGFVDNPYPYIKRSTLVAITSLHEAFPTICIEAMAFGIPTVAVDCPGGINELLDGGKFGRLVDSHDESLFAKAMLETIRKPFDPKLLIRRSEDFSVEQVAEQYLEALGFKNTAA